MVRKDKPKYMGWDTETKMFRRGWTPKWVCPKCGHWNPNDNWRCHWCAYQKQSHKEGLSTSGAVPDEVGVLTRAYRRLVRWKPKVKKNST